MILLLSGEGPTDLGICNYPYKECSNLEDNAFKYGVLTILIDQIFQDKMGYSLKEMPGSIHYRGKSTLVELSKSKSGGRNLKLRSNKSIAETALFYKNAKALASIAIELTESLKQPVIAILFRDSDGTNSSNNSDWNDKFNSIIEGFKSVEGFDTGVPMLAKPKSEAWLLAACKDQPYQNCATLEDLAGNDDSPNSLKSQLESSLKKPHNSKNLVDWMNTIQFDYKTVAKQMPSFKAFYESFIFSINTCAKKTNLKNTEGE